jgi:NitT/TauT family transport system substrate-binding protein
MKTIRVISGIAAFALSASLAGAPAWSAEKLNVGVLKIAGVANAWVARERGIFTKNDLAAKLVEFNSGADAINAMQAGDVDVLLSIAGSAMTAIERGFDLQAVMQNEVGRAAPPDSASVQVLASSNLKSMSDLAGKKMAVSSLNSQQVVGIQMILKKAGVDLKTMQFIEMPFPAQVNALRAGHVDAAAPVDPFTTQLLQSGTGRVLSWSYVESIPEQPVGVWWAKGAFIGKNPKAIDAFAASMKESIDYMNADTDRAKADVTSFTGLNPALVKDMPPPSLDYRVRVAKWQQVVDMMVASNVLQKPHKAEEYFSPQIRKYITQ